MKMQQIIAKRLGIVAILGLFVLSMSSCQREGCPGQITQENPEQVEQPS